MFFATKYDRQEDHLSFSSNPGTEFEITYDYKIDEKGVRSLVPVGKTNIKEYVQSFKDSVDINKLMERFKNGETNVFDKVQGFYADVTDFPTSYAELFARVEEANKKFMELPPETRALFNNSASEFWAQFGTEEFESKLAFDVPVPEDVESIPVDTKEVIDNE